MRDMIYRQEAIDILTRLEPSFRGSVLEQVLKNMPPAQPEIIRCKDCKFAINADTDMMCDNPKSWVVATENDFGCILAERREQ